MGFHFIRPVELGFETVLPPSHLKILWAVGRLCQSGSCTNTRAVVKALKLHSTYHVHVCLKKLRKLGLVDFEDRKGGTLRSTYRFIPVEELCRA